MPQDFIATLSSKGQLTLPKSLRNLLGVGQGSPMLLKPTSEGVLLQRAEVRAAGEEFSEEEWVQLQRLARAKGKTYSSGRRFLKSLR